MKTNLASTNFRITLRGLENQIDKHWCLVSYLIINANLGELVELGERELPKEFSNQMAKYVYEYIYNSKMPPSEIQQTVLNVSEDLIAGREVQLRAGDYISAQMFFRKKM